MRVSKVISTHLILHLLLRVYLIIDTACIPIVLGPEQSPVGFVQCVSHGFVNVGHD